LARRIQFQPFEPIVTSMDSTCFSTKTMDEQGARDEKHSLTRVDTPITTPPPTPTPATTAAHDLYREIYSIYQQLAPLTSLAPCDLVNSLLTRLVTLCIQPYSSETVEQFHRISGAATLCANLQGLCAIAEGELERHWAQKMLQDAGPHAGTLVESITLIKYLVKVFSTLCYPKE
jgi:hypothetical protein